jgi:hypothetical protein
MMADGLPPAILTVRNRPYFRGPVAATRPEAERLAADEERSGRTAVVRPWHGTFAVYYTR